MTTEPHNWFDLAEKAIALGVALLVAWNSYRQTKIEKQVAATAKVVDVIHDLSNSAMGAQKRTLAEVTAAKAAITKLPADIDAATAAMTDHLAHVAQQTVVDSKPDVPKAATV